jgi:hypothetical protein
VGCTLALYPWALGIGHWTLDIRHGAWGMGHGERWRASKVKLDEAREGVCFLLEESSPMDYSVLVLQVIKKFVGR